MVVLGSIWPSINALINALMLELTLDYVHTGIQAYRYVGQAF